MAVSPVAVGGVGGSGTRVIAAILRELGYYMGDDLNESEDNLWFTLLFKRRELWPPREHHAELAQALEVFLNVMQRRSPLDKQAEQYVDSLLPDRGEHPRKGLEKRANSLRSSSNGVSNPANQWGWKEPNTHLFLPFLLEQMPGLKYVHVMRHGLDMAFSSNQNQLKFWGQLALNRPIDPLSPADSLAYWCHVHREIREIAESTSDRVLLLDYDMCCLDPAPALQKLAMFLELDPEKLIEQRVLIQAPASIGRFRQQELSQFDSADLELVESLGFDIQRE